MRRYLACLIVFGLVIAVCAGCVKRDPNNVFPGSDTYEKRIASFKISPAQAYRIAHEAAQTDNRLQFLSRRPTVVMKRWYVFSMPQPSGADIRGYHVHGDTGEVKFVNDKKFIEHSKR